MAKRKYWEEEFHLHKTPEGYWEGRAEEKCVQEEGVPMTAAIFSPIDLDHCELVKQIWRGLYNEVGLNEVVNTCDIPHFTWKVQHPPSRNPPTNQICR